MRCYIVTTMAGTRGRQQPSVRRLGPRGSGMMVLICYDGSADAQAAIDSAGQLMPGSDVTVGVIWEINSSLMAYTPD
jgi:hypothetical protein